MRQGTLIRSLSLGTGLLLAFAGSAQAGTQGDVVTARQPYPLAHATRIAVQGRATGVAASSDAANRPNCRMPKASLSLAPGERAVELRQLSLNLRTCRAVFERGIPPRGTETPSSEKRQKPQSSGAKRREGPASSGVRATANGYTFSGAARAWYRDSRTGKIVTKVSNGADWNASGGCIAASNVWFSNFADRAAGWDEVSHRWYFANNLCSHVSSSSYARFTNPGFKGCQGGTGVDTYYDRSRFIGYPNGGIKGDRRSYNSRNCRGVLIAYFALYR